MLGRYLIREAPSGHQLFGIYHSFKPDSDRAEFIECDIAQIVTLKKALDTANPDFIIHAAAVSDIATCENNPLNSRQINVLAPEFIAKWCTDHNKGFLFTSSDLVFDGNQAPYTADDAPNPLNIYASQKTEAEEKIREACPNAIICRLPLMIGKGWDGRMSSFEKLLHQLLNGMEYRFFSDEYRTPAYVKNVAEGIYHLIPESVGNYHLGGKQRISRYKLGLLIAEVFELDNKLIVPIKQEDLRLKSKRPKDVSLISTKSNIAGYEPIDMASALQEIKNEKE